MLSGGNSGCLGRRAGVEADVTDIDLAILMHFMSLYKVHLYYNSTYLENFLGRVSGGGLRVLDVNLSNDSILFFFS